jgi:hypothetical protein
VAAIKELFRVVMRQQPKARYIKRLERVSSMRRE